MTEKTIDKKVYLLSTKNNNIDIELWNMGASSPLTEPNYKQDL